MSLQSKIYKLNNDLISLFSVMDSWCDRDDEFLYRKDGIHSSPHETLLNLLLINDYILSCILKRAVQSGTEGESDYINPFHGIEFKEHGLIGLAPDNFKTVWFSENAFSSMDDCRERLREHLFKLLYTLDQLHNSRLDLAYSLPNPDHLRGIEIIESLAQVINNLIKTHEQEFELN